nr:pantoate--beta-alanine ligase [Alteribacter natronophilus]
MITEDEVRKWRNGLTGNVGFVPTMGYLHEGHLSLIRRAKEECGQVAVSIFVNPLQFGENEDFDSYPRNEKRDLALAEEAGADLVFIPDGTEMYPKPMSSFIKVEKGTDVLCGADRPGHFDGVATVVTKLFNIVQPDRAYFGLKDAQQAAVIETMVKDYHIPVTIVPCPTVREEDGLAKSSRNVRLTADEREKAPLIYKSLTSAAEMSARGTHPETVKRELHNQLKQTGGRVDYGEIRLWPSLEEADELHPGEPLLIACAVRFSTVRLIDNIIITPE